MFIGGCRRLTAGNLRQIPKFVKFQSSYHDSSGLPLVSTSASVFDLRGETCHVALRTSVSGQFLRLLSTDGTVNHAVKKHEEEGGKEMEVGSPKLGTDASYLKMQHDQKSENDEAEKEFKSQVELFQKSLETETQGSAANHRGGITLPDEEELIDTDSLPSKRIVKPVYNLAALVNKSEVLSNLVKLGVDLSVVEQDHSASNLLIHLDFERDVQPVLLYLHDIGIPSSDLGEILTRNPMILKNSVEDLQNHVNYLRSKNFLEDSVVRIVTKCPKMFSESIEDIDATLGVYQRKFKLTGDEVRHVVTRLPKLLTWDPSKVKSVKFYMRTFLGFSEAEVKQIFLASPRVLLSDRHQIGKRFDYLYNDMKLTHKALVTWPQVFRTRLHVIKQRHLYLQHLQRAQYDPQQPNYVALKALVSGKDRDFCFHVAKSSVSHFNDFLKTL